MFSLTIREQFLVAGILCAVVTGAAVKHWRDTRREAVVATNGTVETRRSSTPSVP